MHFIQDLTMFLSKIKLFFFALIDWQIDRLNDEDKFQLFKKIFQKIRTNFSFL